jgi:hypothetical protein
MATPETHDLDRARLRLAWALNIIQNSQGDVVYKKQITAGKGMPWIISIRLPGVLRISDALTGDVLAESAPGDLLNLAPGFAPPSINR